MVLPREDIGSGDAVVLLHAGVADRSMWSELLPRIEAAGMRALAPDLPGFGEASTDEGPQGPWGDVLDTLDAAGVERAHIVGISFGGMVALRVATLAPGRVRSLALISAPGPAFAPSRELEDGWEREEEAIERGDIDAAVQVVLDMWTLPGADAALLARVAAMQRRAFELQSQAADAEPADPLELNPGALADLDVPALVAVGEHDRREFADSADQLARELRCDPAVVIASAGHLAPLEQPAAFSELLLGFLGAGAAGQSSR